LRTFDFGNAISLHVEAGCLYYKAHSQRMWLEMH